MEQAHKQRLVGGVVLLALGLIFIPLVLDFSSEDRSRIENAKIPPSPDAMKMEVLPLDVWSTKLDPEVSRDARIVETMQASEDEPVAESTKEKPESKLDAGSGVASQTTKAEVKTATAKPTTKSESEAKSSTKRESVAKAKPAPKPTSPPKPVPGSATVWVVQVASLSKEKKAYGLRDKLRQAGHPAFVEQVKGANGVIYRVKSGPVLERSKAEAMKVEIKKMTKLDGLILRHR